METTQLMRDISLVFDEVINTVGNVPENIFNQIPFEGSWTIGQVAEHIAICSRGIPDSQVRKADRAYNENEEALKSIFLDMDQKSKAAEAVTPGLPPHEKATLLERLTANKKILIKIIADKELSELCLGMEFPFMGYLTRYEWLRFVQVHTQRHLNQIKNIQAHLSNQ